MRPSWDDVRTLHAACLAVHREDPEAFRALLQPYLGDPEALLALVLAGVHELASAYHALEDVQGCTVNEEVTRDLMHHMTIDLSVEAEAHGDDDPVGRLEELLEGGRR